MLFAYFIERAASTAVGVADEYIFIPIGTRLADCDVHSWGDFLWMKVVVRRQALQVDMVETQLRVHRHDFTGDHAAGDDADLAPTCWVHRFLAHGLSLQTASGDGAVG